MVDELSSSSDDTIVAVATPPGASAIAVVRLSGPEAVAVARRVFVHRVFARGCQSHRAYHGVICEAGVPGAQPPEPVDEVLILPMLSPRSYTGEDVVEIFCHGGEVPARRVVRACLAAGARPAGPGEFTRRAFLNGRLSLDQAEAVADLIHAEEELAATAALRQLRGGLRGEIAAIAEPLRALLVELEGRLEFIDEVEAERPSEGGRAGCAAAQGVRDLEGRDLWLDLSATVGDALGRVERLLALGPAGRRLREGVQVALVGPPNAGKSSLFNALLGTARAIVDDEPGTTRDVITAELRHEGCRFVLHDTAGLRRCASRVELLGMERTRQAVQAADIVLDLDDLEGRRRLGGDVPGEIDRDHPVEKDLRQQIALRPHTVVIPVLTKADLVREGTNPCPEEERAAFVATSAQTGFGLAELKARLLEAAEREQMIEAARVGVLLNQRHEHRLRECREDLREIADLLIDGSGGGVTAGEEVVATLLAGSLARLDELSGRVFTEALLGEVFSRFCVGK